jgi:P2-related tail formation protein
MSTWDAVLTSVPVNHTAARVVGRRRGLEEPSTMTREELIDLMKRLERKLRLLKVVLGIDTKAKHRNLLYKTGKGMRTYRGSANSRTVEEYIRIGHEMQRMNRTLQALRVAKSGKRAELGGWMP